MPDPSGLPPPARLTSRSPGANLYLRAKGSRQVAHTKAHSRNDAALGAVAQPPRAPRLEPQLAFGSPRPRHAACISLTGFGRHTQGGRPGWKPRIVFDRLRNAEFTPMGACLSSGRSILPLGLPSC